MYIAIINDMYDNVMINVFETVFSEKFGIVRILCIVKEMHYET